MSTTDWFIGSASKQIVGPQRTDTYTMHALGFRGDDQLFVLIVCDIVDTHTIDCSSLHFHIHQHPLASVTAVIVPSGRSGSLCLAETDTQYRHQAIHAITDCVVDALTFGCPAVMRWSPHGIQWRKFDDAPIATLLLYPAQAAYQEAHRDTWTARYGDPVMVACQAGNNPRPALDANDELFANEPAESLAHVTWQQDETGSWHLELNNHHLLVVQGQCAQPLPHHVLSCNATLACTPATLVAIREVYGE